MKVQEVPNTRASRAERKLAELVNWLFRDQPIDHLQRVRMMRHLMGAVSSLFVILLIFTGWLFGHITAPVLIGMSALISSISVCFLIMFRTGLNMRFANPSLTLPQILASVIATSCLLYFSGSARSAFFLIYMVSFLFGVLQFGTAVLLRLSLVIILSAGFVIALRRMNYPAEFDLRLEVMNLILLAAVLCWFSVMGGFITSLRARLRRERDRAEAASRIKSEFLATMSHEIRTPMNGVLGMTELLRSTMLTDTQRRFVDSVYQSGEQLLEIINNILDFSKIEAGKVELERINFDLRQIIEDVCSIFAHAAQTKGLELACRIPGDLPIALRGDPVRLRQIFTNLLGNAVKFTRQGHISVTVSLLREDHHEAMLRIEVQDTGIGMSEENKEKIFDAFSQADTSTTRQFGGTGLGLAIVKQLVSLMKGTISVQSHLKQGSTFAIEVMFDKQDASARSVLDVSKKLRDLAILVVDDSALNREILQAQLTEWNIHCVGCENGAEALTLLAAALEMGKPFALAILDQHMPQMDGVSLARAIKADSSLSVTNLIMLSSVTLTDDESFRRGHDIKCYLTKPARRADLLNAIESVLFGEESAAQGDARTSTVVGHQSDPHHESVSGHILIAEDNPVNQELAVAMLSQIGVQTTVVADGLEAVVAVKERPFDLVLMDCHMANMDGFEATRLIRDYERTQSMTDRVPIVAITANAMSGDRDRCLLAGMDDYLPKPYTQAALYTIVRRWIRSSPIPRQAQTCLDSKVIASIQSLDPELMRKLTTLYLVDSPNRLTQMSSALEASDSVALWRAAHGLKSSSFNMGASLLATQCAAIEALGRSGSLDTAAALVGAARQEYGRVQTALREVAGGCDMADSVL